MKLLKEDLVLIEDSLRQAKQLHLMIVSTAEKSAG
jgi:hypothetical protein